MTTELKPLAGADTLKGLGILLLGIGALWIIAVMIVSFTPSRSSAITPTASVREPAALFPPPSRTRKSTKDAHITVAPHAGDRATTSSDRGAAGSESPRGSGPGLGGEVGGAYRVGEGVSPPIKILGQQPKYTDEARKARLEGTLALAIVVDTDGRAKYIRVLRPLGMGLDENAVEAIGKWRFRPGQKDGRPVPVMVYVKVNFGLL